MDGKTLIHPAQVPVANAAFGPSRQDIVNARKLIEAFAAPENAGKDVIKVDGRMVERLHERMARRTLELADTIRAMGDVSEKV
jgi:citrate lyase subunit beta/citryl-CoA lyase